MTILSKILVPAVLLTAIISPLAAEPIEAPDAWPLVKVCLEKAPLNLKFGEKADFWQTPTATAEAGEVRLRKGLVAELRAERKLDAAVACLEAGKVAEPKKK